MRTLLARTALLFGLALAAAAQAQPTVSTPPASCTWCDVAVTWSGLVSPTSTDVLALTTPGSTTFLNSRLTNGASSGTLPLSIPGSVPFGNYVIRLYSPNSSTLVATSAPFQALPTVSGTVTSGGSPLAGVSIAGTNGAQCNAITDASGNWGCLVPSGWSGTVTPSKAGELFSPASRIYTNVTNHINSNNFATASSQPTVSTPPASCTWCDVAVTWSGIVSPTAGDRIALTTPGSTTVLSWRLTNGASSGTLPLSIPGSLPFGNYVVRLYNPNSSALVATSAPFQALPTVSGTVSSGGSPLAGVSIAGTNGAQCNAITDASGGWGCLIPSGWSGTVTPSKPGSLFSPASRSYTNVTNHINSSNFATAPSHAVSGTITYEGAALSGATVAAGSGTSCTVTNASGQYTCAVPPGWSGTVTPSMTDRVFTPASRSYTNVTAAQPAQGYTANAAFYQVSGSVTLNGLPLANVALAATGGPTCSSSNGAGEYSCIVPFGWSGSVTPSASGYSFGPASRSYTSVASNQSAQTFSATLDTATAPLYFVHVDHLNTPRLVADAAGTTVWKWDQQEPFGVNVPDENPSALGLFEFPLRFSGQYADKETNLAYNLTRDYDASLGRYVQSDRVGLRGGLNTYAYVVGNPLFYYDATGECRVDVRFSQLGPNWYHAYVVATAPNGQQTYFRGGPSAAGPTGGASGQLGSATSGASSGAMGSNSSGGSNSSNSTSPGAGRGGPGGNNGPWGPIVTGSGPYLPGTVDWQPGTPPTITVLNDEQPCACNPCFDKILQAIQGSKIPYNPLTTNSNAVISTLLQSCGFGTPTPPVWAPGWGTTLPR